jgi:hypothetical protein
MPMERRIARNFQQQSHSIPSIGTKPVEFDTNDTNRSQGDIGTIRTRARLASLEGPSVSSRQGAGLWETPSRDNRREPVHGFDFPTDRTGR